MNRRQEYEASIEQSPAKYAERVLSYADSRLEQIAPSVYSLLEVRHAVFHPEKSQLSDAIPVSDQLYDQPGYNDDVIFNALNLRNNGVAEFHNETEKYAPQPDDTEQLRTAKQLYRQSILTTAQDLGFVTRHDADPTEVIDTRLNIQDSELEPIDGNVEAIVVAGAAGLSNLLRVRDAIRNIESGAIDTYRIILASCDRPLSDVEKKKLIDNGFTARETEVEAMQQAFTDLIGASFTDTPHTVEVPYGTDLHATINSTQALIGNRVVIIKSVSAPFDSNRTVNGRPATRTNTAETFIAAGELLSKDDGKVVIESHDTWIPYQEIIGQQTFGLRFGKEVVATGPFKADRVMNGDLMQAEGVVDEISKVYKGLVELRVSAENQLHA